MLSAKSGLNTTIPLYVDKQSSNSHDNNREKLYISNAIISVLLQPPLTTRSRVETWMAAQAILILSSEKSTLNALSYKMITYDSI